MTTGTIEEQVRELGGGLPADIARTFADERVALQDGTDRAALVAAGDVLAPFTLPDATGEPVSLERLLADGPAVIVFYRGAWCPFCNVALRVYGAELDPELRRRGVSLAAISPQLPDGSLTIRERHELAFPVLSDPANRVAAPLGIVFEPAGEVRQAQLRLGVDVAAANGQQRPALPMPTALLVDRDRTIRFADVRPDYTGRTEVSEILAAVDAPAATPA